MIGEKIQHYTIVRLIGEGGMASVYEAVHDKLQTRVAVKVLNPILTANTNIRQRFENEARFMASLNHPNITRVIDYEERQDMLAIVLEYLEGEDLNHYIRKNGAMTPKEVLDVFTQVLDAFEYAHSKSIAHRDVKPSNIFIEPSGTVKILDFGIAKLVGSTDDMTVTGAQIGTPVYMSPEQVNSDKALDHRSDIYSLGVTLYYMLNGKPPYDTTTSSNFQIFTKIVYEPLPDLDKYPAINTVLKKAAHKDPAQRYQHCKEFSQALKAAIGFTGGPNHVSVNEFDDDKTIIDTESFTQSKMFINQKSGTSTPAIAEPKQQVQKPVIEPQKQMPSEAKKTEIKKTPVSESPKQPVNTKEVTKEENPFETKRPKKIKTTIITLIAFLAVLGSATYKLFPDLFDSESRRAERKAEVNKLMEYVKAEFKKPQGEGNYDSTLIVLEKALDLDDENPEVWFFYSSSLYLRQAKDGLFIPGLTVENINEASKALEKTLELDPAYTDKIYQADPYSRLTIYWGELALKYMTEGKKDSAIYALKEGKKHGAFRDELLEYARNTMKYTEQNSLMVNSFDITFHPMIYLQQIENYRTDIKIVDMGFMQSDWYLKYITEILAVPTPGGDWYSTLFGRSFPQYGVYDTIQLSNGENFVWYLTSSSGKLERRQEALISILKSNKFNLPVYFPMAGNNEYMINLPYRKPAGWALEIMSTWDMPTNESHDAQIKNCELMDCSKIKLTSTPSMEFKNLIDNIRHYYIYNATGLFGSEETKKMAKRLRTLIDIQLPVSAYPFTSKYMERYYKSMVLLMDYSEDQRKQEVVKEIRSYMASNNLSGITTASGLVYIEKQAGTGNTITDGNKAKINYTMLSLDGDTLDSSKPNLPLEMNVGELKFIKGFDEGIRMMKNGGKATIIMPYDLGYGSLGSGNVVPYSTLRFDVEIIGIE